MALTFHLARSEKRQLCQLARARGELLPDGLLREALGDLLGKYSAGAS